jgi:hypothetical protein
MSQTSSIRIRTHDAPESVACGRKKLLSAAVPRLKLTYPTTRPEALLTAAKIA